MTTELGGNKYDGSAYATIKVVCYSLAFWPLLVIAFGILCLAAWSNYGMVIAPASIVNLEANYNASPTPETQTAATIPRVIHAIWMANPAKPYMLGSIDSVVRYMPDVTYKLHILTPAGCNATVLEAIHDRLAHQLQPFVKAPKLDLQIVLHDDVPSELIGTPLEGKGITQEHMGGTVERLLGITGDKADRAGSPHGPWTTAMVHAADVYRLVVLYKEGGLYMDTDHMMLNDMFPLLDTLGAFAICETWKDAKADGTCKLLNGFMAAPRGHPFFRDALQRVSDLLDAHSVNGIFPIRTRRAGEPKQTWWTAVGPNCISVIKNNWLGGDKDIWIISDGYPDKNSVETLRKRPWTGKKQTTTFPNETSLETSMTILGRRFFLPTSWQDITLNKNATVEGLEIYDRAYSFHLWEMGKSTKNQIRPHFVSIIRDMPNSVLAHLYKRFCTLICDVEELTPPTLPITDFMKNSTEML